MQFSVALPMAGKKKRSRHIEKDADEPNSYQDAAQGGISGWCVGWRWPPFQCRDRGLRRRFNATATHRRLQKVPSAAPALDMRASSISSCSSSQLSSSSFAQQQQRQRQQQQQQQQQPITSSAGWNAVQFSVALPMAVTSSAGCNAVQFSVALPMAGKKKRSRHIEKDADEPNSYQDAAQGGISGWCVGWRWPPFQCRDRGLRRRFNATATHRRLQKVPSSRCRFGGGCSVRSRIDQCSERGEEVGRAADGGGAGARRRSVRPPGRLGDCPASQLHGAPDAAPPSCGWGCPKRRLVAPPVGGEARAKGVSSLSCLGDHVLGFGSKICQGETTDEDRWHKHGSSIGGRVLESSANGTARSGGKVDLADILDVTVDSKGNHSLGISRDQRRGTRPRSDIVFNVQGQSTTGDWGGQLAGR